MAGRFGWAVGTAAIRIDDGARPALGATGETNGTKAAVLLANPMRTTYRNNDAEPPHRDDSNSELGRASFADVG